MPTTENTPAMPAHPSPQTDEERPGLTLHLREIPEEEAHYAQVLAWERLWDLILLPPLPDENVEAAA